MAHRLLTLAADTIGLKHCRQGAERLRQCLNLAHGFSVSDAPTGAGPALERFFEFIDECSTEDTAVLYLSGHGIIDRGKLFFLLDDDSHRRAHLLDVHHILEDFQHCRALNRLAVLDCCNAMRATASWAPPQSDRYLLMTAARFLERTKEVARLEGSVLTVALCQTLEGPPDSMDSSGSARSVFAATLQRVQKHNAEFPMESAPEPGLLGEATVDFPLANWGAARSLDLRVLRTVPRKAVSRAELRQLSPEIPAKQWSDTLNRLLQRGLLKEVSNVLFITSRGEQLLSRP